jgi:hypothetical protein
MPIRTSLLALSSLAVMAALAPAHAKKCPQQVKSAIDNAYPGAKLESCKSMPGKKGAMGKQESGNHYQAKLDTKDAKEVDLIMTPDGAILVTEEAMAADSVPAVIVTAFESEHPNTKMSSAARQTDSTGAVVFEIAYLDQGNPVDAYYDRNGKKVKEDAQRQSMRHESMKGSRKSNKG